MEYAIDAFEGKPLTLFQHDLGSYNTLLDSFALSRDPKTLQFGQWVMAAFRTELLQTPGLLDQGRLLKTLVTWGKGLRNRVSPQFIDDLLSLHVSYFERESNVMYSRLDEDEIPHVMATQEGAYSKPHELRYVLGPCIASVLDPLLAMGASSGLTIEALIFIEGTGELSTLGLIQLRWWAKKKRIEALREILNGNDEPPDTGGEESSRSPTTRWWPL